MNNLLKNLSLWLVIAITLVSVFHNFDVQTDHKTNFAYSELIESAHQGNIKSITVYRDRSVTGMLKNGNHFSSYLPVIDSAILDKFTDQGIKVQGKVSSQEKLWVRLLLSWVPGLLPVGLLIFFTRQGSKSAFSIGRSRARLVEDDKVEVTFKDVAGIDEVKEEVKDIVDFLKNPKKMIELGAKMPKGILMTGEPGTGKTLLAKAVAGEAKVPFFAVSGSDFVEMFVGVGASRVRDMFEQARKQAPCIIFIDEIDTIGRHRMNIAGNGSDEQTLNQLLVEMDGFLGNESVVVMAATNRFDILDKALTRPGRFDRQVAFDLPDIKGRRQILDVHLKKVKFDKNTVDPLVLAQGTPGFSGADLANLVNEAALYAARSNQGIVNMRAFEEAKDKIIMGTARSMIMTDAEKKVTAYHEAGHTIIGWHKIPYGHNHIHKVTIIPRGTSEKKALGATIFLDKKDRYGYTKQAIESRIASASGGYLAEQLIFGTENITTGAASDIQHMSQLARQMVTRWGLSDNLGPFDYHPESLTSVNRFGQSETSRFSEQTLQKVDSETHAIIERCCQDAKKILKENIDILHRMAEVLMQQETIDAKQVEQLMNRQELNVTEGKAASEEVLPEASEGSSTNQD